MNETPGARYLPELLLYRIPGLRGNERIELLKKFDKEEDFSILLKKDIAKKDIESILGRDLASRSWNMSGIWAMAEKDARETYRLGIRLVSYREEAYPPLLREIFDPPLLLFYRGVLPNPEKPLAAVVGTRKPSAEAGARAFALGRELGEAGIPVVSGLALGIDSLAHRGNIEGKAPTVAVLGSSPDLVYPNTNRGLARRILEAGGLIVSEYPPGTRPFKSNFPARNRIISALARGTVIVEAPERSGALITAQFALDQGRDLWVDRVGLLSERGGGTARLAEDGAGVISSAREILLEWKIGDPTIEQKDGADKGDAAGLASSMAEYLDIKM